VASEQDLIVALEFITEGANAAIPEALMKPPYGLQSFRDETDEIEERVTKWTRGRGVQGLGIGEKIVNGKAIDDLALKIYVAKKKPRSKVGNPVPESLVLPVIGRVDTDVIEIGRVGVESFRERVRPAMPGCSVGHSDVLSGGTFGCLVRKIGTGKGLFILSNSHVLADEGLAEVGDHIVQPAIPDGGNPNTDFIATLAEFEKFKFRPNGYPNLIDAAIARVRSARSVEPEIRMVARTPIGVSRTLKRGMRVYKVGRTTDQTCGIVLDIHHKLRLSYKQGSKGRRRLAGFRDQVLCSRFTSGGDSGSLVLNSRHRAVGLHFAGSKSASIFNRIEHVLRILEIKIVV